MILMADPIVLSQSRKRALRLAFREIQAEQGGGVVVAFANARAPHVQEALEGLAKTNSITDPVYTNDGYAVVKTITPENNADEMTPAPPTGDEIGQQNAAGEELVANHQQASPQVSDDETPESASTKSLLINKPPPTSGPGSGTDAWRDYAIAVTDLPGGTFDGMTREQIIEQLRLKGLLSA